MKIENSKSLTFYYPSRSIGGAQNLIARLAELLATDMDLLVYIIDFEDGFIWSKLKNIKNVSLLHFNNDSKIDLANDTTLVIFPSYFERIPNVINTKTNANLIVWFIQPYLLISLPVVKNVLKFFIPFRVNKVRALLNALNTANALLFMDWENFNINKKYFGLKFEPTYLPIPTKSRSVSFVKKQRDVVNIAWMGRISGEKVETVKYVFNDILTYNKKNQNRIRFHVIGDGEKMDDFKAGLKDDASESIVFKGVLVGKELEQYLLEEIDCMFAMGTSALDSSMYKIPTVVLDIASKGFDKLGYTYKYKWIYDIKEFTLGQDISYVNSANQLSLANVIEQLTTDSDNNIGLKCFEYAFSNHNINVIARALVQKAKESAFKVKDAPFYDIQYTPMVNYIKGLLYKAN
jgi:hypothetical protein